MTLTWILDEKIAVSPMLWNDKVVELSRIINGVVIVVEEDELEHDIKLWDKLKVPYIHIPIPESSAPTTLTLYYIIKWICRIIKSNGKILIHCYSGKGRSCLVAAAYLVYSLRKEPTEALKIIRSKIPGALSSLRQVHCLENFATLLKILPEPKLSIVFDLGLKYEFGKGLEHASRVTELCIKLWCQLKDHLGLGKDISSLLLTTVILQDIGCKIMEDHHEKYSILLLEKHMDNLKNVFSLSEINMIKMLIEYHEPKIPLPATYRDKPLLKDDITRLLEIIRVANVLEDLLGPHIDDIEVKIRNNRMIDVKIYSTTPFISDLQIPKAIPLNIENTTLHVKIVEEWL